jgi:hypothetical protein
MLRSDTWRGARKRGIRDRFGRLLIIGAYVLLGFGLDTGVHNAVGLWTSGSAEPVLVRTLVTFPLWGVAASILGTIGINSPTRRSSPQPRHRRRATVRGTGERTALTRPGGQFAVVISTSQARVQTRS